MNNKIIKLFFNKYTFFILFVSLILVEPALAQNEQKPYFKRLLENDSFKKVIDLGLLIYAGLKWYDYFNGFNPDSAFKDVVTPAVITYIAFNWLKFLGFVGLV